MVQNFNHLQPFCHPGSKGNRFSAARRLILCGAALEQHVFEQCADAASDRWGVSEGEADAPRTRALLKHCAASPEQAIA